jgi:hypothetical protein
MGWIAMVGLKPLAIGGAAGLLIAWAVSGTLEILFFSVRVTDATTVAAVVACLGVVGGSPRGFRRGVSRGSIASRSSGAANDSAEAGL